MRWSRKKQSNKAKNLFNKVSLIKFWQLIILLLIGTIVSAIFLRMNNLHMQEKQRAVINADIKGDKSELKRTLVDLQSYVSSHMNTKLGNDGKGFDLTKTYERDRDAILNKVHDDSSNSNSEEYQKASIECRAKWQGNVASFRNDYVKCVLERVQSMTPQGNLISELKLPRAETYRVNYVSPLWSPDIAGFSVLFCLIIVVIIITRIIEVILIRAIIKIRFRGI